MFQKFQNQEELKAWFIEQERQADRLSELFPELTTDEGLVPINVLHVELDGSLRLRLDPSVEVHPHWRVKGVAGLIFSEPHLWQKSAIRVQSGRSTVSRVTSRGVPFRKALDIVHRQGLHKSTFWIPYKDSDAHYAMLLICLKRQQEQNGAVLEMEAWQWIGTGVEVLYIHAILTDDASKVAHLDGAIVCFSCESEVNSLFWTGVKKKGVTKEKYFRVDEPLLLDDAVILIKTFCCIEELVDEYFEYASE